MTSPLWRNVAPDAETIATPTTDHAVTFPQGVARAFRVGTAGNVEVVTYAGSTVAIPSVQVGETVEILFTTVTANTTADDITLLR